jgi:single-stranded-DNA-specific exonuclease
MNSHQVHVSKALKSSHWVLADPPDPKQVEALSKELRIPQSIAKILLLRGINSYEKAREYFRPTLAQLHDPFLMNGMDKATTRVLQAVHQHQRICVFGDYDVDGTNGASMLYLFLKGLGADVSYYIPDRLTEGYGVSRNGIEMAAKDRIALFISVDCGITALEQTRYARELGIDVIICDHHEVGPNLPEAVAVLDPLKPGDAYPFKGLCGCGVAFKLIHGLVNKLGKESELHQYLDFVTLASTADIVPLNGENRILVKTGLEMINKNPRTGIRALAESAGLKFGSITTGHIVFALAPRINAVGRLGDATRAVRLLVTEDDTEGRELAGILEEENRNRRRIDEETFSEAQLLAEQNGAAETDPAIVLHQSHWHPGVIGIVASRMVEKYYKPAIMMATVDGVAKGSARSVPGFDIYVALKQCGNLLIQFGGHKYAAGLTVDLSSVEEFKDRFKKVVGETMTEDLRSPTIRIDTEISLSELTPRFVRILREFAPFGPSNPRPVFVARGLETVGTPRIVGKNHLRFRTRQDGIVFDAIAFNMGHLLPEATAGIARKCLSCVFSLDEQDAYTPLGMSAGESIPQLKVRDLRFESDDDQQTFVQ